MIKYSMPLTVTNQLARKWRK